MNEYIELNEYIERKRAIVDACNSLELYPSEYAKLEDALNKISAADVAPVKHGRWIFDDFDGDGLDYQCSVCRLHARRNHNFCPNCGARMDLED